jgi:hypothetical protein
MNAPHPKLRTRKCKQCGNPYVPFKSFQKTCMETECLVKQGRAEALKRENKDRKEKRKSFKSIPERIAEVQIICNRYIRLRDYGKTCICCNEPMDWVTPNQIDAGHYRSRGAAGHLRFDERNIHAQRKYCNKYKAGNQAAMRLGVIERIGLSEVMALENDNEPHKWTHQELDEKEQYFKAKLKELKRERGE